MKVGIYDLAKTSIGMVCNGVSHVIINSSEIAVEGFWRYFEDRSTYICQSVLSIKNGIMRDERLKRYDCIERIVCDVFSKDSLHSIEKVIKPRDENLIAFFEIKLIDSELSSLDKACSQLKLIQNIKDMDLKNITIVIMIDHHKSRFYMQNYGQFCAREDVLFVE